MLRYADIVFFIYLYQRWIYPVDRKRASEFSVGDDVQEKASETKAISQGKKPSKARPAVAPSKSKSKKDSKRFNEVRAATTSTGLTNRSKRTAAT